MTVKEMLDFMERSAQGYLLEALPSILRNHETCGLKVKDLFVVEKKSKLFRRFAGAVLVDFINHLALEQGENRGERIERLAFHR